MGNYSGITRSSHIHLDGSRARLNDLPYLHVLSGKQYHLNQWADHHKQAIDWFSDVHKNIVEKFSITTGVMQNPVTIFKAAEESVVYYRRKGIEDLRLTAAPQYHTGGDKYVPRGFLNERTVGQIFIAGLKEGMRRSGVETGHDIRARLLFGIGREVSPKEACRLTVIAGSLEREFVSGISLVCHEPSNPPEKHIPAFQLAKTLRIKERRCHVEWVKDRKPEEKDTPEKILRNYEEDKPQLRKNLETAIFKLEATHIDHAFSLFDHDDLIEEVVKRNIGITVCPGTLLFGKFIPDVGFLKLRKLLEAGVRVSIDADDDLFMPDLDEVFQLLNDHYKFTTKEMALFNQNA